MKLPNVDRAIIDAEKIRDYLLSESHVVGRFKAAFFARLGYSRGAWERLAQDLLILAHTGSGVPGKPSAFGLRFEVDGILIGPTGRSAEVRTVWMVRATEDVPRSITAFPR